MFLPAFRGVVDCDDDDFPPCPVSGIVRGDPSSNGRVDLTEGILILNFLFRGGPALLAAAQKTPAAARSK